MASRPSPLSLKARAIALLAQREHSVAELRRKLLRLAQLRDLQAWEAEQAPLAGASARDDVSGPDASSPALRTVGSFDLAEDWDEGELDAFRQDWDSAGVESTFPDAPGEEGEEGHSVCPGFDKGFEKGLDEGLDRGSARSSDRRSGFGPRSEAGPAGAGPVPFPARGPQAGPASNKRSGGASEVRGGSARRVPPSSRRPAEPSAQAWSAVMDDERQQARVEEVEQLLQWLQQRSYLSESRLVESRINARASRYGNLRIQQELRQLGVAADEEQQARLKDSELERARDVWRRKFGGEAPVDAASRARQMRFLAARGFSSEVVRKVLKGEDD